MGRLNRVIGDVTHGKNKDAAALFDTSRGSLSVAALHGKSAADILPQLAQAFQHTHSKAMQAQMAMALFGREGMELLPLLTQGREKLQELSAAAAAVVFVPEGDAAEQLEQYHTSLLTLTAAVEGFMTEIGSKLAPVLKPVVDLATRWVVANRDWISTKIAQYVRELAHWVEALRLERVIEPMAHWGRVTAELVDSFGGVTTAVAAFAFLIASPAINAVLGIIGGIGRLVSILRMLSLLAWSNPILASVALVGAAVAEMIAKWNPALGFFGNLWAELGRIFQHGYDVIRLIVSPFVTLPRSVMDAWRPVGAFFVDLWGGIKTAFWDAWSYIGPLIDKITAAARALSGLANVFGGPAQSPNAPVNPLAPDYRSPMQRLLQALPPDAQSGAPPVALPQLYRPGGALAPAAGAPGANGTVRSEVIFRNAPPGTVVRTRTSGIADLDEVDVGRAMSGLFGTGGD